MNMISMTAKQVFLLVTVMIFSACSVRSEPPPTAPMADIHLHYNWNQAEVISPEEVIEILKTHHVTHAVVSSRPSHLALKLRDVSNGQVLPIYSPYYKPGIKHTWYLKKSVLDEARKALASGQYAGIGEMHLVSGRGPHRDNPVVLGLIDLARQYQLPLLIHTDASSSDYLKPLCQQHGDVRFLWAHAGGILDATEVDRLMDACPNVWVELSARDPWHYDGLVGSDGKLLPGWTELFEKNSERFMTGTDPVWNAHQTYRWYEADEGWSHYAKLNRFHRQWMLQLSASAERKIRIDNALKFFSFNTGKPASRQ